MPKEPQPYSDLELDAIKERLVAFHDKDLDRFLDTITADRREMAMCHKRIEELERERDNYMESARLFSKNTDYYTGLLDKIAKNFGKDAFISDDGSVQDSPLRAKMPQLVKHQTAEIKRLRGALEKIIHCEENLKRNQITLDIARQALAKEE